MLSIRTQDRMALVPYDSKIEIKLNLDSDELKVLKLDLEKKYRQDKLSISLEISKVVHTLPHCIISKKTLGTYATKERALEVLDEIEQHVLGKLLIPETIYHRADHLTIGSNPYVETEYTRIEQLPTIYQMPKE